mmetsp:Transcript_110933/g.227026  ORF Transcript_110933/g.227026 Transcript_110933/m.227026 type:complete len:80 (+) Transcript_110933:1403-1642(+)
MRPTATCELLPSAPQRRDICVHHGYHHSSQQPPERRYTLVNQQERLCTKQQGKKSLGRNPEPKEIKRFGGFQGTNREDR